jgi:hypothetical protein
VENNFDYGKINGLVNCLLIWALTFCCLDFGPLKQGGKRPSALWVGLDQQEREMERNRRQAGLNEMKTYIY